MIRRLKAFWNYNIGRRTGWYVYNSSTSMKANLERHKELLEINRNHVNYLREVLRQERKGFSTLTRQYNELREKIGTD